MSRAFVREDAIISPEVTRPSPARHLITENGLATLKARLTGASEWERQRLAALIAAAEVRPAGRMTGQVAFGHRITAIDGDDRQHVFVLVGEHEADPARGRISWHAPLGQALMGAERGDSVEWRRPIGPLELEVVEIEHDL